MRDRIARLVGEFQVTGRAEVIDLAVRVGRTRHRLVRSRARGSLACRLCAEQRHLGLERSSFAWQLAHSATCAVTAAETGSPMASASSSVSSGQVRVEGIAQVLVEFLADGTDLLQDAAGVDVDGVGLDIQSAAISAPGRLRKSRCSKQAQAGARSGRAPFPARARGSSCGGS